MIIDISHHQNPSMIDYDKLAKQVKFVIIRTQYGSRTLDKYYRTHHAEFRKRGIPAAAYAWIRGINTADMRKEANDFYSRTKDQNPTFWFLDVEEISMKDMREGVKAYVEELRKLGAKKVGAYIAHHLYEQLNLDLSDFDAIWIPRYGPNNGKLHDMKPNYPCDLWQYTSRGKLDGYDGNLDLNIIVSEKSLEYFTNHDFVPDNKQPTEKNRFKTESDYVKAIQQELKNMGIYAGDIDGVAGPKTLSSVRKIVEKLNNVKEYARKILDM